MIQVLDWQEILILPYDVYYLPKYVYLEAKRARK